MLISYRIGDVYIPQLDSTEALKKEIEYLLDCLEKGLEPVNNGQAGLMVVKLLEAANKSISHRGQVVPLK